VRAAARAASRGPCLGASRGDEAHPLGARADARGPATEGRQRKIVAKAQGQQLQRRRLNDDFFVVEIV
jgi:hypothetical protein